MALKNSTMLPLGTLMPDFSLQDTDGEYVSAGDFLDAKAVLVMFICNHCPYVVHVRDEIKQIAEQYQAKGVAVVGVSANSIQTHPQDGPDKMNEEKAAVGYTFPYLYDETQDVAKVFRAACTPDFYVFDGGQKLTYRGQLDDSRPGNDQAVTGADLRAALDAALAGNEPLVDQRPSAGCNIKWHPGNEPDYF
ncbi:MAG: thioredoxin family protein [Candidatus Hinthialibacter antarcticus]|nr:thioredoxin family protein [Candidatus Hinthialibacter antarcticus]